MACKIGVAILFTCGVQLDNGVISPSIRWTTLLWRVICMFFRCGFSHLGSLKYSGHLSRSLSGHNVQLGMGCVRARLDETFSMV